MHRNLNDFKELEICKKRVKCNTHVSLDIHGFTFIRFLNEDKYFVVIILHMYTLKYGACYLLPAVQTISYYHRKKE